MEYMGNEIREENPEAADVYRKQYINGIANYIKRLNIESKELRCRNMPPKEIVKKQEKFREEYRKILGMSLFMEQKSSVSAKVEYVGSDMVCRIYRLIVPITDEIPFYSLFLLPHDTKKKVPLVIAQHGGGGTPELCCDMNGKNNYNHMVQRVLKRGAAVLAPQLALWAVTEGDTFRAHEIPYNRESIDVNLKRFGSSITAMEISGIMKSLDYVLSLKGIDDKRIAMIGLSYGGYFTLYTMAADTRIQAGYCAGAFNDRSNYPRQDWCYKNSGLFFQDAEVAALCAPRKLYIQIGKKDPVFDYHGALHEAERVRPYYEAFDKAENFQVSCWEGGHTISDDDLGYEFLFSELGTK